MPLMMALWLLILRGLSIELRSHQPNRLWRSYWDGMFTLASVLLAIVLGAALGNVVRGVPLDGTGFFAGPLFTDFRIGPRPGVLDWYTILLGVFALLVLAGHGALYLAWKTSGPVHERSRALAPPLWIAVLFVGLVATYATPQVRPFLYANLLAQAWTWLLLFLILGSLGMLFLSIRRSMELPAFLCSALFIVSSWARRPPASSRSSSPPPWTRASA
jgi:cytochrome d ubiquinol oxidase subunit II